MTDAPASRRAAKPRYLQNILALDDFEVAARRFLPRPIFGYVASIAETGEAMRDNRSAFGAWAFVPRVLNDVSQRSLATNLFEATYSAPFGIAPMGMSSLAAYRGDLVLAGAAHEAGIPMIMSGASLIRLEDVAEAYPGTWFQAYLPGETERIDALLARVSAAGFTTLVLTVDAPVATNPENNIRSGFSAPLRPSVRLALDGLMRPRWTVGTFLRTLALHGMPHFENSSAARGAPIVARSVVRQFGARDQLNWRHVALIRQRWVGRLVVKGIADPRDAALAAGCGVDGIIVSNHGGRQLDGTIAPLRALESIRDAARDMTVMLDGGIRRGSDVLKAIALGAHFVFVGRPFLYAAAIGGRAGVIHAIDILRAESDRNLGLLGLIAIDELSKHAIALR